MFRPPSSSRESQCQVSWSVGQKGKEKQTNKQYKAMAARVTSSLHLTSLVIQDCRF